MVKLAKWIIVIGWTLSSASFADIIYSHAPAPSDEPPRDPVWTDKTPTLSLPRAQTAMPPPPMVAAATSCSAVVKQMFQAFERHDTTTTYPWHDPEWLKATLGTAWEDSFTSQTYLWGDYKVETRNGLIVLATGEKPEALKDLNGFAAIEDLLRILGKPTRVVNNKQVVSSWRCPETRSEINLTVGADQLSFTGNHCEAGQCQPFVLLRFAQPKQPVNAAPPILPTKEMLTKLTAQQFKSWFNLDAQTEEQLAEAGSQIVAKYYNKLKQCTPGIYKYPVHNLFLEEKALLSVQPRYFLGTSAIAGTKDGKCIVETVIEMNNKLVQSRCEYSKSSLEFYSNDSVKDYAHNSEQDIKDIQRIAEECKPQSTAISTPKAPAAVPSPTQLSTTKLIGSY